MKKDKKNLVGLGLLATVAAPAAFAQIVDHTTNNGPTEASHTTLYVVIVAVVLVAAFLFFRSKSNK